MMELPLTKDQRESLVRLRGSVKLASPGQGWTEPALAWQRLVGQICAVGSSRSWEALSSPEVQAELAVKTIRQQGEEAGAYVHGMLARIRVRYCSPHKAVSAKAQAIAANALSSFVATEGEVCLLANLRSEVGSLGTTGLWSVEQARHARRLLVQRLAFFGPKSASDFLIGLGLVDCFLALDVRLLNLLVDYLGWDPLIRNQVGRLQDYEALEQQVIQTLGEPLNISPAHLDRLLFQHYETLKAAWCPREIERSG